MNIFDAPWYIRYTKGFYWSITTFLLVGSKGDSFEETIFCILVLIFTKELFA